MQRQALYFRRLFLPQHVRADIRDSELSALDDETPYDRAEFVQVVNSGARYNFVTWPS